MPWPLFPDMDWTGPRVLSAVIAVLSNLASNVPAVLLFKPIVPHLADPNRAWLILAMALHTGRKSHSAGFGGKPDRDPEGSSLRLHIFWEYFKVGLPLTVVTIAVGVLLLR